jgi:hypothetical protein
VTDDMKSVCPRPIARNQVGLKIARTLFCVSILSEKSIAVFGVPGCEFRSCCALAERTSIRKSRTTVRRKNLNERPDCEIYVMELIQRIVFIVIKIEVHQNTTVASVRQKSSHSILAPRSSDISPHFHDPLHDLRMPSPLDCLQRRALLMNRRSAVIRPQ